MGTSLAMVGLSALPFFLWLCATKEKIRATKLCELLEEKYQPLEKVSLTQKELKGLQSYMKEVSCEQGSAKVESLEATCGELERSKSQLMDEILFLEKELQEQKAKCSQQHQLRAELSKTEQFLQKGITSLMS
jgi:predicted RNase H-like nuclease (RuvC/YqgF family)